MPVPAWRYRRPRIRPCRSGRKYFQLSLGTGARQRSTACGHLDRLLRVERDIAAAEPADICGTGKMVAGPRDTVEAVASTGLPTAASLRQHFSPRFGTSPALHRAEFAV